MKEVKCSTSSFLSERTSRGKGTTVILDHTGCVHHKKILPKKILSMRRKIPPHVIEMTCRQHAFCHVIAQRDTELVEQHHYLIGRPSLDPIAHAFGCYADRLNRYRLYLECIAASKSIIPAYIDWCLWRENFALLLHRTIFHISIFAHFFKYENHIMLPNTMLSSAIEKIIWSEAIMMMWCT